MAKLKQQFDEFLSNIEPDDEAIKYAHKAHVPIREHLESDPEFQEYFKSSFLYGSYARHTAVNDIKDIDIVILTSFDPHNPDHNPKAVLKLLKKVLNKYYDDSENTEYQRKSIKVKDPLPDYPDVLMTLDIIPAIETEGADSSLLVPDIKANTWVKSHPKGHMSFTKELNDEYHSIGNFVPLVKMMKHWWTYVKPKKDSKPKGFWLEVLIGNIISYPQDSFADYFISTLENIIAKYSNYTNYSNSPDLNDPGLPNETIKTSMTIVEFINFMDIVVSTVDKARDARAETDLILSSKKWSQIFGDEFPTLEDKVEQYEKSVLILGDTSHVEPLAWLFDPQFKVSINAYTYIRAGGNLRKLGGLNSNGRQLKDNILIKYVATTNTTGQYSVRWQVVNTGIFAAKEENGLRGQFFNAKLISGYESTNPLINWEHTKYTGKHWIECFIIQGNRCVARSGRFYVNIRSQN